MIFIITGEAVGVTEVTVESAMQAVEVDRTITEAEDVDNETIDLKLVL